MRIVFSWIKHSHCDLRLHQLVWLRYDSIGIIDCSKFGTFIGRQIPEVGTNGDV